MLLLVTVKVVCCVLVKESSYVCLEITVKVICVIFFFRLGFNLVSMIYYFLLIVCKVFYLTIHADRKSVV